MIWNQAVSRLAIGNVTKQQIGNPIGRNSVGMAVFAVESRLVCEFMKQEILKVLTFQSL